MLRIALFVLLFCTGLARGQCDVAPVNRVLNRTNHQCVWSTLETQARHWGYKQLYDLTQLHHWETGPREVCRVLSARGANYYWQPMGPHCYENLRNAMARHWPTSVGLRGEHMILLVDLTPTSVKVIDNMGPKALQVQEWPLERFERNWDGWSVTLKGK